MKHMLIISAKLKLTYFSKIQSHPKSFNLCNCRRPCHYLEGHLLCVSHKHNWGCGFIHLQPQANVLSGSNVGSDGVEQASSFIIQNHQIQCSIQRLMYEPCCKNMVCGWFSGTILTI